ncbi:MAG: glycosyltransferase family 1 protein [Pedobacter sp.]|nr:MAG: glycosyltransferase family 1 protein [Pedobacter sp.]
MKILFIGEDLNKSRSGVVTVMNQILGDESLKQYTTYQTIFTTSDDYSTIKKLICWMKAYLLFIYYLPSCQIIHIHHASDLNFWLSGGMVYIANMFGKKSLLHNHSADFKEFYNSSSEKRKRKIKNIFKNASATIVLSNQWLNWYNDIAPEAKFYMLQNAIDVPDNVPSKKLNIEKTILVYLARIEKRKGFFDLMKVMPELVSKFPNIELYVAGQGDVEMAKSLVTENRLEKNVSILGYINNVKREEILKNAHILVFPSYNEGLPMSLLEAMSYGLVPITTPVGGIPDVVVQNKNGLLVNPGDTEALKKGIIDLLNAPDKYADLSINARQDVDREFNYKNYGVKLVKIYDSIR